MAEGLLYRNPSGRWVVQSEEAATGPDYESLPLPRALLELVRRRLSSLSSAALRLAEIAAVLGLPQGTARSRLHHAHKAMRAALEAEARVVVAGRETA